MSADDFVVIGELSLIPGPPGPPGPNTIPTAEVLAPYAKSSEIRSELRAGYAPIGKATLTPGRRWAYWGDSITNGSSAIDALAHHIQLANNMLGAHARRDHIEAATSGYTSEKLLKWMPSVLEAYPDVSGSVVMVGTNDAGGLVPVATYAANVAKIVAMLKPYGPVVLCTPPPKRGTPATAETRSILAAYGNWIRLWGPANGCEVAEVFGALADPATGDMLAAYDADGTHPNTLGHLKMAQAVVRAQRRTIARRDPFGPLAALTGQSVIVNPLMSGALGSGTPSNWYEQPGGTGTAPTYSKIADTTGLLSAGQWAQMDFDGTTAGGTRALATAPPALGGVPGDLFGLFATVLVEDVSGDWETNVAAATAAAAFTARNQSFGGVGSATTGARTPGVNLGNLYGTGKNVYLIGPALTPFRIPNGMTGIFGTLGVTVPTGSRYRVRLGAADFINFTALGLADLVGGTIPDVVHVDGPPNP